MTKEQRKNILAEAICSGKYTLAVDVPYFYIMYCYHGFDYDLKEKFCIDKILN
jgi:hypothetical protein